MKKTIIVLCTVLIVSCRFSSISINKEPDENEGKRFLNNFYQQISDKSFDTIDTLVSDSLKQMAGTDGISKMATFINSKVGNYKSYAISDYYIRHISGSDNETSYNYKLKVTYDKGVIDEIVGMRKQNGSAIKLNSYHANSDLLIK